MSDDNNSPNTHEDPYKKRGLVAWFARNAVAANLLMFFFLITGFIVAKGMHAELMPSIDPRIVSVSVPYPGASPEDIEQSITQRVEEAVIGIEGVKRVRSSATQGLGQITVELKAFAKSQLVKDDVQTAVDQLSDFPPANAEQASISVPKAISAVITIVVSGNVDDMTLRQTAEDIERDLRSDDAISSIVIQGSRDYEISIDVDEASLQKYNLSIDQIAASVRGASVNSSAGSIRTESGDILLRVNAEARTGKGFEDIVIKSEKDGRIIRLKDIATITDGFEDVEFENRFNQRPAIFLLVNRTADEGAFAIKDAVDQYLESYTPPPGMTVQTTQDFTKYTKGRINLLLRNGIMGLALVFVFLSLTLDMRLAFWTSLGIPIAFLGAFIIVGNYTTINQLSLFALVMVLGLVVDDAIVVGENIYEEFQSGKSALLAAIDGTQGVMGPVVVGVVTTMAAFSPVLFGSGILGQIIRPLPIVVIAVLAISLVEVFLILPSHLSHGDNWSMGPMRRLKLHIQNALFGFRDRMIIPIVRRAVQFRYFTTATCLAILMVLVGLFQGGQVKFIFFDQVEGETVSARLVMPDGTPYAQTEAITDHLIKTAYETIGGNGFDKHMSTTVTIGGQLATGFELDGGTVLNTNIGYVVIELLDPDKRDRTSADVARDWQERIGTVAGAESLIVGSDGFQIGDDISLNLSHTDTASLRQAVTQLREDIATVRGISNIRTTSDAGKRQIEFILNDAGSAAGLTVRDIANQVRQNFFGAEVQRIQRGRNEIKVYVRLPRDERNRINDIETVRIRTASGQYVPLHTVARMKETRSDSVINHIDGRRIVTISADVDEAIMVPNEANAKISELFFPDLKKQYPKLLIIEEGQAADQAEEFGALSKNFSIALLVMFMLLASVLRSYVQPLMIMAAIPFGLVGAIAGHSLMGYTFSFLSVIGVVALSGVVINDSVVLIDYYNKLARQGMAKSEAVIAAVRRRFRPIFLTTMTTFIGLAPILFETSIQAQFVIPMAISLGFGIVVASSVTVLLIPSLLIISEDIGWVKRQFTERVFGWVKRQF